MGARSLSEFLARFLDTRAPLLFVIGSLVLGLFSNAAYGLLLVALGESPWTLVGIIVAAVVILPLIYGSFRVIVRALSRPQTQIGEEQRVPPHQALILLVSANMGAPEKDMIVHHQHGETLKHCWLLVTPAVRGLNRHEDLRYELNSRNVEAHLLDLADAHQGQMVYTQVRQAVRDARALLGEEAQIIVDITGGTKPMTAGAVLACRELRVNMEYAIPAQSTATTAVRSGPAIPILVTFSDAQGGQP